MAFVDYFPSQAALDGDTGVVMKGVSAQVFDLSDTGYLTPLVMTDLQGISIGTTIVSSSQGWYPAFRVAGHVQVVAVSSGKPTYLTSVYGLILNVFPDPTEATDGLVIGTQGGEYSLVPMTESVIPDLTGGQPGDVLALSDDGSTLQLRAIPAGTGTSGREVQLQTTATHIQWRYVGDQAWTNLVALSTLTGAPGTGSPGPAPQLRVSGGYVQWKLATDTNWLNLIATADLGGGSSGGVSSTRYFRSGAWQARGASSEPVWFDAELLDPAPIPTDWQPKDKILYVGELAAL